MESMNNPLNYLTEMESMNNPLNYPTEMESMNNPLNYLTEMESMNNPLNYPTEMESMNPPLNYPTKMVSMNNPLKTPPKQMNALILETDSKTEFEHNGDTPRLFNIRPANSYSGLLIHLQKTPLIDVQNTPSTDMRDNALFVEGEYKNLEDKGYSENSRKIKVSFRGKATIRVCLAIKYNQMFVSNYCIGCRYSNKKRKRSPSTVENQVVAAPTLTEEQKITFFIHQIGKKEAEQFLQDQPIGTWLCRTSQSIPYAYVFSIRMENNVKEWLAMPKNGGYSISNDRPVLLNDIPIIYNELLSPYLKYEITPLTHRPKRASKQ